MTVSKFQKFGIRRDKNLSDVANANTALANLLDGLVVADEHFLPEDIKVINGVSNTEITTDDFRALNNTNRTFIPTGTNVPELLRPLVTIRDNVQNFKVITEDPPIISGGPGPAAYFYPSSTIAARAAILSAGDARTLTVDDVLVTDVGRFGPFDFWENGRFIFSDKVYPEFEDTFGAVLWEGFVNRASDIKIDGNCLVHVEQDLIGDGSWTTVKSFYSPTRTVTITETIESSDQSTIQLSADDYRVVMVGDEVTNANTAQVCTVIASNNELFTITVSEDLSGTFAATDTLTLFYEPGNAFPYENDFEDLENVSTFGRVAIRILVWWPDPAEYPDMSFQFYNSKEMDFGATGSDSGGTIFPFTDFYREQSNNTPDLFTYRYFLQNRVSESNPQSNAAIETSESLTIDYEPALTFAENILTPTTPIDATSSGRGFLQRIVSSTPTFNNINIGDWLVTRTTTLIPAQDVYVGSRVIEKEDSSGVFIDQPIILGPGAGGPSVFIPESDEILALVGFEHIGLVGLYYTTDGSTLEPLYGDGAFPTSEVKVNNFIGCVQFEGTANTDFAASTTNMMRVTDVTLNNANGTVSVATQDFQGGSEVLLANSIVAVYSHTGLQDLSGEADCVGVYGREVAATGTNNIFLTSVEGIGVDDWVQYWDGTQFRVTTVSTVLTGSNQIELQEDAVVPLQINSTLIFVDSAQPNPGQNDKSFCVLPLNTAPPFVGTDTGLQTSPSFPALETNKLAFTNLKLKITNGADINVANAAVDTTYSRVLRLDTPTSAFNFLIK